MVAMASWPTTVWFPLENSARICPAFPIATDTSWDAGDPSWETAETDEGWAYWLMSGVVPEYRFQFMDMSAALSASPVITSGAGVAVLEESEPSELKVREPVSGANGGLATSAFGTATL